MTGTTQAVIELLKSNIGTTAAEAVAALPGHNPATVRTQIAKQRKIMADAAAKHGGNAANRAVRTDIVTVEIGADCSFDPSEFPTAPYEMIVLQARNDHKEARIIVARPLVDRIGGARSKANSLRSGDGTDSVDREWIKAHGGCTAIVILRGE